MKKISLIALACTLVYTGCLVDSKADTDSQIKKLGLSSKIMTQLDTLDGFLKVDPTIGLKQTHCNVVPSFSNSGNDDRFFLGKLPGSSIDSKYRFRLNLSDSLESGEKNNIHALLADSNFWMEFHVDTSFTTTPKSLLIEYKKINTAIFDGETYSTDSLHTAAVSFFSTSKTWSDSLGSNSAYTNSFTTTPTNVTSFSAPNDSTSSKPASFRINFSTEFIAELQSKKKETLIYDFQITNLDQDANQWLFSRNSPSFYPTLEINSSSRQVMHHAECATNQAQSSFLTTLSNDTLNLNIELTDKATDKNLIRRAWLLLDKSTYTSGVEDSIVKEASFYNTSRLYSEDTLMYQEASLDTLSQSRTDLILNKEDLSLPITSIIDHSVADTSSFKTEIRFSLSSTAIDSKYFYNNLAWFQLNSENTAVKIVVERLVEEIE
ncbi:hypothetical protein OAA91_00340 [Fibrobacterales bacterium]|nr:hypothetical protein [Fibrobacterales bacterium]